MLAQKILRPVHGQLDWHFRLSGQIEDLQKLLILIAANRTEAFDFPSHYRGEAWPRRLCIRQPLVHAYGLPRMLPLERGNRHGAARRADVAAEGEQRVESAEELQIPRHALGDCQLRKSRIAVDERREWDARILIPPKPAAAREIENKIRVAADAAPGLATLAVVFAGVVHITPSLPKPMRGQAVVDEVKRIARISGLGVGSRVVVALAGVFQIPHLMAQLPQPQQVIERAP